jgi:hypothetical protein
MPQPVKVSDELLDAARTAAKLAHRSAAGQIEYWASLGRSVERALTITQIESLMQSGEASGAPLAPAAVPPPVSAARPPAARRAGRATRPEPVTAPALPTPDPAAAPSLVAPPVVAPPVVAPPVVAPPVVAPPMVAPPVAVPSEAPGQPAHVLPVPIATRPAAVSSGTLSDALAQWPAVLEPSLQRRYERVLEAVRQGEAAGRPVLVVVGCADAGRRAGFVDARFASVGAVRRLALGAGGAGASEVDAAIPAMQHLIVTTDLGDSALLASLRRWRQQGPLVLLLHLAGPATDPTARAAHRVAAAALSSVDHLVEFEEGTEGTVSEAW